MTGVLVGRDGEVARLLEWVEEALDGWPRIVLVVGDAGIGKSTLVGAVARDCGARVVTGRSTEVDGAPPFRPWRQILRSLDAESLLDPDEEGREPARFARFDAVTAHLSGSARDEGLVVVFEDAHRADGPSVGLLAHTAESLASEPVCLVVTVRGRSIEQSEAFRAALPVLSGQPGSRRLDLDGLDDAAVRVILGSAVDAAVAEQTAELTGGNPLFVTELSRHLAAGGDPARLPRSIVDSVRARIDGRSARCVEVLRIAAVIGREFAAGVVSTALDVGAMECLEAIEEAERAGLIEPMEQAGWFRFAHVVVRDAVEDDLGAHGLATMHRRVAQAIETYEGTGDEVVTALARHWDAASALGDHVMAAEWSERAATAADRRMAWEESARLYDRAVVLAGPDADPLVSHRRLLGSARARLHCDDIGQAIDRCVQAAGAVEHLDRPDLLADAALVVEGRGGPTLVAVRDIAEAALAHCDPDDDATRARLLGQLASCAFYLDPPALARLSIEAMDRANRTTDPLAMVAAARARQMASTGPEAAEERLDLASVMTDAGRALGRPSIAQWGPIWRIDALVELGRLPEAVAELGPLRHRVAEVAHPISHFHLSRCEGLLAQATGRFDEARIWCEQTCRLFARLEDPLGASAMQAGFETIVGLHVGIDSATVEAWDAFDLSLAPPFLGDLPVLNPLVAVLGIGDVGRATALYGRLAGLDAWQPPSFLWLHLHATRLWAAIALGRLADVEVLVERLALHRGLHVAAGAAGITYLGPVELWTGIGAAALGRIEPAIDDLRAAHQTSVRIGAIPFAVHAGVELVRVLQRRGTKADDAEAASLLAALTPQATTFSMTPWVEALGTLGSRGGPVRTGPLSPREMEVAALVARGLTNRAIAKELFVSERTAQNHVQHILTKLSLANRTQIATWYADR